MSPPAPKKRQPAPARPQPSPVEPQRLQKVLAAAGLGSRRKCEEYILEGRVSIDGDVVEDLGMRVDPQKQDIRVDHVPVQPHRKIYFMLNKPKGVLCTNRDPGGRARVVDLFPGQEARLFPVGRLDENSEGLILVTNDGELGNRLAHPRYGIPRTYRVQVAGSPTRHTLEQLREGLYFSEGKFRVDSVKRVGSRGRSTSLELVLSEGKNREIRRLLARVGHKVQQLRRIGFGPLKLGNLEVGRYRRLTSTELAALRDWSSGRRPATKSPAEFRRQKRGKPTPAAGDVAAASDVSKAQSPKKKPDSKRTPRVPQSGKRGESRQGETRGGTAKKTASGKTAAKSTRAGSTRTGSTRTKASGKRSAPRKPAVKRKRKG